jgi:hypothetical protein
LAVTDDDGALSVMCQQTLLPTATTTAACAADPAHPWGYTYDYTWYIGPVKETGSANLVEQLFRSNLNTIFPFGVNDCGHTNGQEYCTISPAFSYLNGVASVLVTFPTPGSFEFTIVSEGFFDAPGSHVTFSLFEQNGNLYLNQHGYGYGTDLFGEIAYDDETFLHSWQGQACKLQKFLGVPETNEITTGDGRGAFRECFHSPF